MDLSPGNLVASFLLGTIGLGLFVYGKKQRRAPHLVAGVALMTYPMFVSGATWNWVIGATLIACLWTGTRAGLL